MHKPVWDFFSLKVSIANPNSSSLYHQAITFLLHKLILRVNDISAQLSGNVRERSNHLTGQQHGMEGVPWDCDCDEPSLECCSAHIAKDLIVQLSSVFLEQKYVNN